MTPTMAARALPLKNFVLRALLNPLRTKNRIEPIGRWNIVVGDTVQLNTGRDKGKAGKVKKVLRSRNRLVVEGLNLKRKHVRPTEGRAGGVISIEAPLHYSNVNLVDAASGCVIVHGWRRVSPASCSVDGTATHTAPLAIRRKRTRVVSRWTPEGKRVRISKVGGGVIPIPPESQGGAAARDTATVRAAEPGAADTPAAAVARRTYNPPRHLVPFLTRSSSPLFSRPRPSAETPVAAEGPRLQ